MKSSAEGMGAIALIADMSKGGRGEEVGGRKGGWTVEGKKEGGGGGEEMFLIGS